MLFFGLFFGLFMSLFFVVTFLLVFLTCLEVTDLYMKFNTPNATFSEEEKQTMKIFVSKLLSSLPETSEKAFRALILEDGLEITISDNETKQNYSEQQNGLIRKLIFTFISHLRQTTLKFVCLFFVVDFVFIYLFIYLIYLIYLIYYLFNLFIYLFNLFNLFIYLFYILQSEVSEKSSNESVREAYINKLLTLRTVLPFQNAPTNIPDPLSRVFPR
jgi:hypothetical protein